MRAIAIVLLVSAVIPAVGGHASPVAQTMARLFPADGELKSAGPTVMIRVGAGVTDNQRITPVTFLSKPGTNTGEGSKSMCGLIVASRGAPPQAAVTVGIGVNQATPACEAVLAIGAVPAARGESTRRLGVIHAISSQNAADGRAVVILRRTAGKWQVDDGATTRADTISHYTIAELRRIL